MTFKEWKEARARLGGRVTECRAAWTDANHALERHDERLRLQVSFASGVRVSAMVSETSERPSITMADGHGFLSIGMLNTSDLAELIQLQTTIEMWKAGAIADLPYPKEPFGRWICPKEVA